MLIEPFAGDDLGDNLNPVGAAYYGFSTLLCTPCSLSQDVGTALGAQAGDARLRDVVTGSCGAWQKRHSTSCSKQRCDNPAQGPIERLPVRTDLL
jgi:hypothetical protein